MRRGLPPLLSLPGFLLKQEDAVLILPCLLLFSHRLSCLVLSLFQNDPGGRGRGLASPLSRAGLGAGEHTSNLGSLAQALKKRRDSNSSFLSAPLFQCTSSSLCFASVYLVFSFPPRRSSLLTMTRDSTVREGTAGSTWPLFLSFRLPCLFCAYEAGEIRAGVVPGDAANDADSMGRRTRP